MKDIKWEFSSNGSVFVKIGAFELRCLKSGTRWFAYVYTSHVGNEGREGPLRHSLSKSKEDAVRIAREMLLDHQAGLVIEMKKFDLEPCFYE